MTRQPFDQFRPPRPLSTRCDLGPGVRIKVARRGGFRQNLETSIGLVGSRDDARVVSARCEQKRHVCISQEMDLDRLAPRRDVILLGTDRNDRHVNVVNGDRAAAIYAHRHTVAYRLDRVKELTSLDPMQSEDRERLGLGLKAYRIIAPRLPR